ncbi:MULTISPECIES: SDR family oxidoreductase [unclassified Beijerinckia]|uniref:SDR family oxidoreductase n=1 Tax=unclassified Beijerinckia TaxID=2638183 RepID=UPI00089AE81A|nr:MULTISPECIES: SDR family oxidoreductase [unclassified Beijerinckia]MDH7794560.1 NAD(P)-dependent dehydrogenase (short-subunit alcohol dehydrogenase family) [Beijerinckia sp. GAS462]SEB66604.1 NAD(P)-dependent dehydrogenase, short-chain alcohol dehydrogenase family [Beijerinckia sp. 28-YEA-48]
MELTGRRIVVTGAGRGLGRAFAEACVAAGAETVIVADIDVKLGEACAADLRQRGADVQFIAYDQSQPQSIEAFGKALAERFDRIDGLVNNAALATGIGGVPYDEIEIATFDRVMAINVRGVWLVIKALAPLLKKSTLGGRIVNVASDTAMWGAPNLLHYVASKGAIISMTRSLSRELGPDGISVNAIAPGIVISESTEYVPQERHDLYVNNRAIPRQQMPEDVTGPVVYLLGPGAGFVTGQLVPVNGGFVMN